MADLNKIVDELSSLTVLEAAELSKLLEEKWGVSAAAPVAVAAAPGAGGAEAPGEEKTDFEQTLELVKYIKFINSFSFIFSPRPGTTAYKQQELDQSVSKERLIELQHNLFQNQINHNKSLERQEINVLVENKIKDQNKYFGRNEYFNSVIFEGYKSDIGKIIKVNIENSNQNSLFGKKKDKMKAA